jgi:cytochrome b561
MPRAAFARADRYSSVAIAFHWTLAVLIILNLMGGLFYDSMPRGWGVMPLHKATGITVLLLSVGRLAWRLSHQPPAASPDLPAWERALAKTVHWSFYVLMIVVPLTGWAMVSNAETLRPLQWYGMFGIPYLPVSRATAGAAHDAHEILGYLFTGLVVLHVAAALRHHLVLRDSVLLRMLPVARASA